MADFSNKLKSFLDSQEDPISRKLTVSTVKRFGCEKSFFSGIQSIHTDGFTDDLSGWQKDEDFINFYEKNKLNIMEYGNAIARRAYFNDLSQMLQNWQSRGSVDGVNEDSAIKIVKFIGEDIAQKYNVFIERVGSIYPDYLKEA